MSKLLCPLFGEIWFCRSSAFLVMLLTGVFVVAASAQTSSGKLQVFGYFQTALEYNTPENSEASPSLSFSLRQANIFLQKDLARNWTSFVSVEILNSFSTGRQQGEFNLDEAWIRYRRGPELNVKLGLQIPEFNRLNTIKNRTPLLPYIFRPLVYETSLGETIFSIGESEYFPRQAYASVYGTLSVAAAKIEYALYAGNSPNISTNNDRFQSGIDTSFSKLGGGRVGIRYNELKAGISLAYDQWNIFRSLPVVVDSVETDFQTTPRWRVGGDFLHRVGRWSLESEYILVHYDTRGSNTNFRKHFAYGTLGLEISDQWFAYASYYLMSEKPAGRPLFDGSDRFTGLEYIGDSQFKLHAPNIGLTYNPYDNLRFKTQVVYVRMTVDSASISVPVEDYLVIAGALSVYF